MVPSLPSRTNSRKTTERLCTADCKWGMDEREDISTFTKLERLSLVFVHFSISWIVVSDILVLKMYLNLAVVALCLCVLCNYVVGLVFLCICMCTITKSSFITLCHCVSRRVTKMKLLDEIAPKAYNKQLNSDTFSCANFEAIEVFPFTCCRGECCCT